MNSKSKVEDLVQFLRENKGRSVAEADRYLLDEKLNQLRQYYLANIDVLIQSNEIIPMLAEWLAANMNSPLCTSLIKFVIRLYELMGFNRYSDINGRHGSRRVLPLPREGVQQRPQVPVQELPPRVRYQC
jgi:hypothetical protein